MSKAGRGLLIGASAVLIGLLTAGAAAAGFTTGLTPGNSKLASQYVDASFLDAQGNQISIQAQSGRQAFRPRGGGPLITEETIRVSVFGYIVSSGLFGGGCWTVPATPFVIRANDMSAMLAFDSSAPGVAECPGDPVNVGEVVPSSLQPRAFSDGINGGVAFTASWTPIGTTVDFRSTMNVSCGPFGAVSQSVTMSQNSSATGTVSSFTVEGVDPETQQTVDISLAGTYATDFALVSQGSFNQTVKGPSTGTCGPFGSDAP
jgi:hypothetical protein